MKLRLGFLVAELCLTFWNTSGNYSTQTFTDFTDFKEKVTYNNFESPLIILSHSDLTQKI